MSHKQQRIYSSRDTTPRQRRLAAHRDIKRAQIQIILSAIAGGILLGLLIICLSFL
jgi:hypothetical protein